MQNKITLILDWSLWDYAITHHYETESRDVKELMYALTIAKQQKELCVAIITPELKAVLSTVFGSRPAFDFLLENGADIETSPVLPLEIKGIQAHTKSMVDLAIWKTIKTSNVFFVTEDQELRDKIMQCSSINVKLR